MSSPGTTCSQPLTRGSTFTASSLATPYDELPRARAHASYFAGPAGDRGGAESAGVGLGRGKTLARRGTTKELVGRFEALAANDYGARRARDRDKDRDKEKEKEKEKEKGRSPSRQSIRSFLSVFRKGRTTTHPPDLPPPPTLLGSRAPTSAACATGSSGRRCGGSRATSPC